MHLADDVKFALITPSYAPDFERCRLLTESVERCLVGDDKHYVVVDRRDVPLFRRLTSSRIRLLVVEDLLPRWIFRVPGFKKWWMSLRTPPIRNWVLQQLVKMSVFDGIDEDVVVFCDSDNALVRPFDLKARLMKDGRLALLRVPFQNQDIREWTEAAKRLLGVTREIPVVGYVGNLIAWRRQNVAAMRRRIEEVAGTHWIRAVCRHWNISEYMIYGTFVEHVAGLDAAGHFPFDEELIKPSWGSPLRTAAEIDAFFDDLKVEHVGVMIHSKQGVPVEAYRERIRECWNIGSAAALSPVAT